MRRLGLRLAGFIDAVESAESAATASDNEGALDARNLQALRRTLRGVAAQLTQISAPSTVASYQRLLIQGVLEYASELADVVARLKRGEDPPVVLASISSLRGVKDMEKASREINSAGYRILSR